MSCVLTACSKKEQATLAGPVNVDVEVVGSSGHGAPGESYSGTVEAADASTVSFSVPGTITKIYVEDGQKVAKGQLLAKVKSDNLINSRNIAQAELAEARDAYQRLKKLHDADALPDIKWVEIQEKLKQAENAADLANRAVGDATIYSPISGYVTQKFANDGQTVVPAEPIVKIVSLDDLQVAISVPENEISSFGPATTAVIRFDVADGLKVAGKMAQKGVVADPLTRSYTVKFDISDTGGKVLPGMIGTVDVSGLAADSVAASTESVVLPAQAVLLSSDNRQFVWVVKDGKACRKDVVADELADNGVIVKSGLARGDSVIVAGMQKVSTGTSVSATR
ncbi:MAG: efflux RND transporter periplasmic adaptor subunit [Muribaculaceae bacterium]|nr:efflux RND transporter periplasmic adaptor subunit [Muribaculaceae bacterium]